jgi:hypothetical protein
LSRRRDGTAQVAVYQLKRRRGSELGHLREWCPPLFPSQAGVAELLWVLDPWHAAHHLLASETLEALEMLVSKPRVP